MKYSTITIQPEYKLIGTYLNQAGIKYTTKYIKKRNENGVYNAPNKNRLFFITKRIGVTRSIEALHIYTQRKIQMVAICT